jgi:hypothetical protein
VGVKTVLPILIGPKSVTALATAVERTAFGSAGCGCSARSCGSSTTSVPARQVTNMMPVLAERLQLPMAYAEKPLAFYDRLGATAAPA